VLKYKVIGEPHHENGSQRPQQSSIKMLFFQTIVAYFLYFVSFVSAADTNAWKSRSIYFVLTDRIARSSSDTGGNACGNLGNYCGGTFKGLESKLDYIQGLGFDAIWITPVVASKYPAIPQG
jgi:alpha-amylase